jgi:phenylacetate-CoA ligase
MARDWKFPSEYYNHSLDTLNTALDKVPAYCSWRDYDPGRQLPVDERYLAMPAFTKKDIREYFPQGLVPIGLDLKNGLTSGEITFVETSGTTDDKVTNIWNQQWWDASERASWKLNSHTYKMATGEHREAILVSPLNAGFASDEIELSMEKRLLSRYLYLNEKTSTTIWTPQYMDRIIRELGIFKPVILEANPSLLAKLCRYVIKSGQNLFQPGIIVLTYECPARFHLQQIQRVFTAPIVSSYGATETGYVFMQCEQGKFHQNTEFCRVDFQPFKKEHGGPSLGRILVTTFNNPWYYLLRFDVGDMVRIEESGTCPCGRDSGIVLSDIAGRFANATLTCNGRLVSFRELDDKMNSLHDIEEYRIEQIAHKAFHLHLVSQRKDNKNLSKEALGTLKDLYGKQAEIKISHEAAIVPEVSGKYRISRALFPIDVYDYLDEHYISNKG